MILRATTLQLFTLASLLVAGGDLQAQNNGLKLVNGAVNYIDVKADKSLIPQGGITVEAWITYDENLGAGWRWPTIMRQNPTANSESFVFRVDAGNSSNRNLRWFVQGASQSLNVLWTFPTGTFTTWKHVAGTYDGTSAKLYVDGVMVASRTGSIGPIRDLGNVLKIGNGDGNAIETWNGEIDEVRLWPYARSGAAIKRTMNLEMQRVPGQVSTWNFNNTANDTSGKNNGAWMGATKYAANTLKLIPRPVSGAFTVGAATSYCEPDGVFGINSIAAVDNADFAVIGTGGVSSSATAFLFAAKASTTPLKIAGVDIWIDFTTLITLIVSPTDALGTARLPLPIPNDPTLSGVAVALQAVPIDAGCAANNLSGTPALSFQIR